MLSWLASANKPMAFSARTQQSLSLMLKRWYIHIFSRLTSPVIWEQLHTRVLVAYTTETKLLKRDSHSSGIPDYFHDFGLGT